MSEIILPGNIDIGKELNPQQLAEIEKQQEQHALNAEIAGRLCPIPPYHPEAPVCDAAWWQNTEGVQTKHHGKLQFPVWSHGRCIGPACVRFMPDLNVCGRLVQDYAAAVAAGVLSPDAAKEAILEAALPPPEAPPEQPEVIRE